MNKQRLKQLLRGLEDAELELRVSHKSGKTIATCNLVADLTKVIQEIVKACLAEPG